MRNRSKLLLAAFTATIVMSLAVGSASARRFEVSSQNFRIRWAPLIFAAGGGVSVSCPVTLSGSFHSKTLSKVSGQLIGYVNVAQVGAGEPPCTGGTARARTESLPWHVQYNSFGGSLPRITSVTLTLVGARFEIVAAGVRCEAGTTQANPAWGRVTLNASGVATEFKALEERTIPLGGEFLCNFVSPANVAGGTTSVDNGAGAAITVRLVQ